MSGNAEARETITIGEGPDSIVCDKELYDKGFPGDEDMQKAVKKAEAVAKKQAADKAKAEAEAKKKAEAEKKAKAAAKKESGGK